METGIQNVRVPGYEPQELNFFCVVCRGAIPVDRAIRGAVTCTREHAKLKKQQMRDYRSSRTCKYCHRPPLKRREKPVTLSGEVSTVGTLALGAKAIGDGLEELSHA